MHDDKHERQLVFDRKVGRIEPVDLQNDVLEYPPVAISCGTYNEYNFQW